MQNWWVTRSFNDLVTHQFFTDGMAAIVSNANSVLQAILSGHCQITMRFGMNRHLLWWNIHLRNVLLSSSHHENTEMPRKLHCVFALVYKYSQFFSGGDLRTEIFVSGTEVFRDAKMTESPYEWRKVDMHVHNESIHQKEQIANLNCYCQTVSIFTVCMTDRQAGRQAGRQTERQTDKHTK